MYRSPYPALYPALYYLPVLHLPGYTPLHHPHGQAGLHVYAARAWQEEALLGSDVFLSLGKPLCAVKLPRVVTVLREESGGQEAGRMGRTGKDWIVLGLIGL